MILDKKKNKWISNLKKNVVKKDNYVLLSFYSPLIYNWVDYNKWTLLLIFILILEK